MTRVKSGVVQILIADDEVPFAVAVARGLKSAGYGVTMAHDGNVALDHALSGDFDLILLDLMLPGMSGYRVVEHLRKVNIDTPVLMLTAKDGEYDEADALDLGVDDYLTKPVSAVVLLARIRALLRRVGAHSVDLDRVLQAGPIEMHRPSHRCVVDGVSIDLTAREFDALAYLVQRPGDFVSKQELLDEVWSEPDLHPNVVEVCIGSLRKKIGSENIQTIRGVGYRVSGA